MKDGQATGPDCDQLLSCDMGDGTVDRRQATLDEHGMARSDADRIGKQLL